MSNTYNRVFSHIGKKPIGHSQAMSIRHVQSLRILKKNMIKLLKGKDK